LFALLEHRESSASAVINNASAISITKTLDTPMKKYDLMHQINNRGTFMTSKVGCTVNRSVCEWFEDCCTVNLSSWPFRTC
jgi:hypothetical protein